MVAIEGRALSHGSIPCPRLLHKRMENPCLTNNGLNSAILAAWRASSPWKGCTIESTPGSTLIETVGRAVDAPATGGLAQW